MPKSDCSDAGRRQKWAIRMNSMSEMGAETKKGLRTDEVNSVSVLGSRRSDEEIVGFDVSVNERLVVHALDARYLRGVLSETWEDCKGLEEHAPSEERACKRS